MSFINELALVLLTGGLVHLFLSKAVRIPVVVSYLFSGILVGNIFSQTFPVLHTQELQTWSEIGIIFLLFSIGMEFNLQKFLELRTKLLQVGILETLVSILLLLALLQPFLTKFSQSLTIALCFSVSSTAIIAKILEDQSFRGRKFTHLVISTLVFEDIAVIFILLLIPTIAASAGLQGLVFIEKLILVFAFAFLSIFLGFFLIPLLEKFLKKAKTESQLIFTLGFGLGFATLSHHMGLSHGIGAFVAGSLLASLPGHNLLMKAIEPIRNLFMAIFFVATGLLFEWEAFNHFFPALALAVAVMGVKFLSVSGAFLLTKERIGTSLKSGLAMTAMGEFSLLLINLAYELGMFDKNLFQTLILAVILNILIYSLMTSRLETISNRLLANIPERVYLIFDRYRMPFPNQKESPTRIMAKLYGWRFLFITVTIMTITLLTRNALIKWGKGPWDKRFIITIGLLISLPFFWALIFFRPKRKTYPDLRTEEQLILLEKILFFIRALYATALFLATGGYLLGKNDTLVLLAAAFLSIWLLKRELAQIYRKFEKTFEINLTTNRERPSWSQIEDDAIFGEPVLNEVTVSSFSALSGKTLEESKIREKFHVTIAAIDRAGQRTLGPARTDRILPGDKLFVIGAENDVNQFMKMAAPEEELNTETAETLESFSLESVDLPESSAYSGKPIIQTPLKNTGGCLIVGIERDGKRLLHPDNQTILQAGDRIWLAGDQNKVRERIHKINHFQKIEDGSSLTSERDGERSH